MKINVALLRDEEASSDVLCNVLGKIKHLTKTIEEAEVKEYIFLYNENKILRGKELEEKLAEMKRDLEMLEGFFSGAKCKKYIVIEDQEND